MLSTSLSFQLGFSLLLLLFISSNAITSLSSSALTKGQQKLGGRRIGGKEEIGDVKSNKEVQDLGKYSVDEFNKRHQTHLSFSQVVEAQKQVVSGIKYYLKIDAVEDGSHKKYDATVVVKAWLNSKELVSFAPSTD